MTWGKHPLEEQAEALRSKRRYGFTYQFTFVFDRPSGFCRVAGHSWPRYRPSRWSRLTRRPDKCRGCGAKRYWEKRG